MLPLFASCARGIETLVARELAALGAGGIRETVAGVYAEGDLATAYRIGYCASSSRCLLRLGEAEIWCQPDDLYALARQVRWHEHFRGEDRFAIHVGGKSAAFRDTRFAMLRVKDAIADAFRERTGARPYVDAETPDALVHIALKRRTRGAVDPRTGCGAARARLSGVRA
ncbi:MAG: THUMP domain-containing protein [Lysobacterales bacterium]